MLTRFPFQSAGAWKDLRYQPMPPGKNPPPEPLGLSLSGLLSMLQSWGRSTARQEASENEGASAPLASPRMNFHPASAAISCLGDVALAALMETGTRLTRIPARMVRVRGWSFMKASFGC